MTTKTTDIESWVVDRFVERFNAKTMHEIHMFANGRVYVYFLH